MAKEKPKGASFDAVVTLAPAQGELPGTGTEG